MLALRAVTLFALLVTSQPAKRMLWLIKDNWIYQLQLWLQLMLPVCSNGGEPRNEAIIIGVLIMYVSHMRSGV